MAEMSGRPDPVLSDYFRFARRNLLVIGVMTVLGLAAGVVQALLAPDTYTASAQVFAPATPVHPGLERKPGQRLPREVTVDTETQILRSSSVIGRVATALGVSPETAAERLVVTVPTNTRVLTVSVSGSTPDRALNGVGVATDAYLVLRAQIVAGVRQRHLEALQSRIGVLESRLASMTQGTVVRNTRARTHRQALIRQINEMERQVSALQKQDTSSGEIVRTAVRPRRPDRNNSEVPPVSYAAIGLLAGIGLGVRRDRRAGRTRHDATPPQPRPRRTPV
ncbi:hypothetical protein Ppa06_62770 [Planomonospora parontospora subsp. parontospora]|uniref:Polysaccharide chain length determinant N-terminal domain-containing protein n=3 Tax=Planomonospora parontospora TaxID=58119 RepID=A0AA37F7S6_9ACTN|nr:hypothetical protein GCM10010126_63370 [Planomonospora parontospora]GII12479.1 hypothetical protein Ppa06_62770 [Planomonospora parontospora subsp. parontospora]